MLHDVETAISSVAYTCCFSLQDGSKDGRQSTGKSRRVTLNVTSLRPKKADMFGSNEVEDFWTGGTVKHAMPM